jgi:AraC-like DNA-binding protein
VNDATQIVLANLDDSDFSVERFAELLNLSRSQLHRKLTQLTGLSASHFLRKVRIEKAKDLLREQRLSVSEVAYATGFGSPSYFTRSFSESEGMSPTDYVRKAH